MHLILSSIEEAQAAAFHRFCADLDFVEIHHGSILDLKCDAIVGPANSFGFMDGGIDAAYLDYFGHHIQDRVHRLIAERHHGELLVGAADVVETGNAEIPYLIIAPTMRVPMVLTDSVNGYLAARAAFLLIKRKQLPINRLAMPALGTGVGQLGPNTCARQIRAAIDDILLGQFTPPSTWAEASERHQLLYTDHPRRLQE